MKTSIWGPSAWRFLHAVTFAYPDDPTEEHKSAVVKLFESLKLLLPCGDCCSHYCSTFNSKELQAALKNRKTLSKWLFDFHNEVNSRLKKPEAVWEQVEAEYLNDESICSSSCEDKPKKNYFFIFIFLLLLFVIKYFIPNSVIYKWTRTLFPT